MYEEFDEDWCEEEDEPPVSLVEEGDFCVWPPLLPELGRLTLDGWAREEKAFLEKQSAVSKLLLRRKGTGCLS